MTAQPSQLVALDGAEVGSLFDPARVDDIVFREGSASLSVQDFGGTGLYRSWFERNSQIYTFLLEQNRLVGYVNVMPLADEAFAQVLAGTLADGEIQPTSIRQYQEPGDYKLYLCSIAVLPEFRTEMGSWLLFAKFKSKLRRLQSQGIRVSEMATTAWTSAGQLVVEYLGLRFHSRHPRHGEIYHGRWSGNQFCEQLL